jgi:anti-anti-sigma regulatory factor
MLDEEECSMSVRSDVDEMEPALQLWIDRGASAASVRCAGTLDAKTGHHVLDAVVEVLDRGTSRVTLDATDLRVADLEGAHTLTRAQRTVREGGALLVWRAPAEAA